VEVHSSSVDSILPQTVVVYAGLLAKKVVYEDLSHPVLCIEVVAVGMFECVIMSDGK
jgi:hypothetical protein